MTDQEIDSIINQMPGGVQGFCKDYGYRQFARAVIEASRRERIGEISDASDVLRERVNQIAVFYEEQRRSNPSMLTWSVALALKREMDRLRKMADAISG